MRMISRILPVVALLIALSIVPQSAHADKTVVVATALAGSYTQAGYADGIGAAVRFSNPQGIALSRDGSFAIIADDANYIIRKLVLATRQVTTLAGSPGQSGTVDGVGPAARFFNLDGIALSSDGSFALIAEGLGSGIRGSIRRLDLATRKVTTLAYGPDSPCQVGAPKPGFSYPVDVVLSPNSSLAFVVDQWASLIRRVVVSTGAIVPLAGNPCVEGSADGVGTAAQFDDPRALALSPDGSFLLVADQGNHTIRKVVIATGKVTTVAGTPGVDGHADGIGPAAQFYLMSDIVVSNDGRFALVVDYPAIRKIDLATNSVTTIADKFGSTNAVPWNDPHSISLSRDDRFGVLSDLAGQMIWRMDLTTRREIYLPLLRK